MVTLYEKFDSWCQLNGQRINLTKSSVIFFRRSSPVPDGFALKPAVTNVSKMLGVYVDSNFNFQYHAAYLRRWLKVRTTILRRLRVQLGVSADVLIRVCQCYRSKICFGTWWSMAASDTTLASLDTAFSRCVRASLGFSKLVPSKVVHEFSGISSLKDYLPYWGASRSVLDYMRDNFDIIDEYMAKDLVTTTPSYRVRASTTKKTLESKIRATSKFPLSAAARLEQMIPLRKFGIEEFTRSGLSFKMKMKSKFLTRIIAKGTFTSEAVARLNKVYFEKITQPASSGVCNGQSRASVGGAGTARIGE